MESPECSNYIIYSGRCIMLKSERDLKPLSCSESALTIWRTMWRAKYAFAQSSITPRKNLIGYERILLVRRAISSHHTKKACDSTPLDSVTGKFNNTSNRGTNERILTAGSPVTLSLSTRVGSRDHAPNKSGRLRCTGGI